MVIKSSGDFIINDMAGYSGSSTELLVGYIFGDSEKDKLAEAKRREELNSELDSLKSALKETADQTDKNTEAIDSLGSEIQKVRTDVDDAIEELKEAKRRDGPREAGAQVKERENMMLFSSLSAATSLLYILSTRSI